MRILFLTSRLPYPPNRGDRVRILNFARVLSLEHVLHLLSFVESEDERSAIPFLDEYFATVSTVMLSQKRQFLNMGLALLCNRSLWVQRFWSAEMQRKVNQLLQNEAIDIVYCYTTRMGKYVENRAEPYRILDFVDAVFLLASRMASHTHFWPKRWLLNREARFIERTQVNMESRFDDCWIVSAADREAIVNSRESRLHVVPQGVDTDYFAPLAVPPPQEPTLLFVGYMGDESVAALLQFYDQVLDEIVEQFPNVVVNVVGANPPARIVALGDDPHINVFGFVPDLRTAYAQAHLLIAPMPFVAGVQTKILEALAMGIPTVMTRYANAGIKVGLNEGALIVDNMSEFAAGVKRVLSDPEEWHHRALFNGRKFVVERFRWEIAAERVWQIARSQ